MSFFAKLDRNNNRVIKVVVASDSQIGAGVHGNPALFVECFTDGRRNRYPLPGDRYNEKYDVFITSPPGHSWILDDKYEWQPPFQKPIGEAADWDETTESWRILPRCKPNTL